MFHRRLVITISLLGLFISVYSLSFSGRPISVDEQLYLTVTRNIAVLGEIRAEQLSGNLRLQGDYHGVELAHPVLASLWYKFFASAELITWQVLYLLPLLYTALSCVFLYLIATSLGYKDKVGIILSLLYGFSTLAFPYAKTFFREPLVVLLNLGVWLAFLNSNNRKKNIRFTAYISFVLFSILLILTKIAYIVVPMTFSYILIANLKKEGKYDLYTKGIKVILLLASLGIIFLLVTRNFTDQNIFYRFSGALLHDAINIILFATHAHFFEVILGSLFSPLKGLFFYSPIILLGFYAMATSWKKHNGTFLLPLVVFVTLLLVQALAHDDEWWTPPWGNRYLLPVISLFLVASLPVLDNIISLGRKGYAILVVFLGLGFLIQLPAVLFNSSHYAALSYASTPTSFSETLWNFSAFPIFRQWEMAKIPLYDLMLWRTFSLEPFLALIFIFAALVLFSLSIYWLFLRPASQTFWTPLLTSVFLSVFLFGMILKIGVSDPVYNVKANLPLCDFLQSNVKPDDLLIVDSYPEPIWYFLSAYECGQGVWYSLPYSYERDKSSLSYQHAHNLLSDLLDDRVARVWVIFEVTDDTKETFRENMMNKNNYRLVDEDNYASSAIALYVGE